MGMDTHETPKAEGEETAVGSIVNNLEYALGRELAGREHWAITEYVNEGGSQEDYNEAVGIYSNLLEDAIEKHGGERKERAIGEAKAELGKLLHKSESEK